ncbi:MAG: methyltransferase [Pseudomonadota bacterium]
MKADHRHALRLALETIAEPPAPGHARFLNASPVPELTERWKEAFICEQAFRPDYLALQRQAYHVKSLVDIDRSVALSVFLLGRNRRWNAYQITRMWNQMSAGSSIIVAGNKNEGIGSIRKWFSQYADVQNSFSKYHSIVFRASVTEGLKFPALEIEKQVEAYHLREGVFSADGPDTGSQLLLETVDQRIAGKVADFGAGWGYLSCELPGKTENIVEIDLYEADENALNLARTNLELARRRFASFPDASFHWIDVVSEFPKKPYDWVIMNPPFHVGRAQEPHLGQRFIEIASSTLKHGGRLLMVANKNLPYERALQTNFRSFEKLLERDGFKVFEASR